MVEEQQSQLNQYECAAGQCVSELQKAQLQVQSLQAKIHESEANNMVWPTRVLFTVWMCSINPHVVTLILFVSVCRSCRRS